MRGYIILYAGLCVDLPCAADGIIAFEDDMLDEVLQVRLFMLDFMGKDEP